MAKKKTILDPIKCLVCEKEFVPKDRRRVTCSRSCGGKLGNTKEAREKGKQTRLEKYGDPNFNNREKVRKTIQAKYGEEYINTSQVPHIKAKIIDTYTKNNGGMGLASKSVAKKVFESALENLGVENDGSITHVSQVQEIKDKISSTNHEKYGGTGFASEELAKKSMDTFKETYGEDLYDSEYRNSKIEQSFMKKYGVKTPWDLKEFVEKAKKTKIKKHGGLGNQVKSVQERLKESKEEFLLLYESKKHTLVEIADKMGVTLQTVHRWAKELGIQLTKANRLNETWQLLIKKEIGVEFEFEGKIYGDNKLKADLFHMDSKIAIEINPTITHSTQPTPFHNKRVPIEYHRNRAILAEENGWLLIQIFDWDEPEEIISLLKSLLNIEQKVLYARKCTVKEISIKEAKVFLKNNHRQGDSAVGGIAFGLFNKENDKEELIQIMTFGKERFVKDNGNNEYEIIRSCAKKGFNVIGGANKIFKAFVNSDYCPNRIKTFVDYSKGQGKSYEKLGMKFVGLANLNGLYANIDTGEAYKVTSCTSKFKKEYEKLGMTQQQYMNSKRFYRINDAGNKIFEWKREDS